MPSVVVDNVGMDVPVEFGDSRSKGLEIFEELISCRTNEHRRNQKMFNCVLWGNILNLSLINL